MNAETCKMLTSAEDLFIPLESRNHFCSSLEIILTFISNKSGLCVVYCAVICSMARFLRPDLHS